MNGLRITSETTTFKTTLRGSTAATVPPAMVWLAAFRAHKLGCPEDVVPTMRDTRYGVEFCFEWPA